jgi:hypothetical protein
MLAASSFNATGLADQVIGGIKQLPKGIVAAVKLKTHLPIPFFSSHNTSSND